MDKNKGQGASSKGQENKEQGSGGKGQEEIQENNYTKEIEELKAQLKGKDATIEDQKNKLLRALADFDNYKKRTCAEKEEITKFSNEILITSILPAVDGFERAIDAAQEHSQSTEEILKGLALVKKQLEDTLVKFGVEAIETLGKPFDPHVAEAIMQKESKEPEHTVIEEMQRGYKLNGKLIRPAMVIVSKGASH